MFLPTVVLVHRALAPGKPRKLFLLLASYCFYAAWDWRFLGLIVFSSSIDYLTGAKIAAADDPRRKKHWLLLSLFTNLGLLGYFKYSGFFVNSAADLLSAISFQPNLPVLEVLVPVGISFYTFQTLSYTIDIWRGQLEPARTPLDFFLFVAFFPQLVAGPIVRASEFLPQLVETPRRRAEDLVEGFERFLVGLFKKVMIADLAAPLVDAYFDLPGLHTTPQALIAITAFSLQIYFDFSGYSDMAIGLGRMLGYRLPENFRLPYLARSITDFWRRWHISLSAWFRDYLYIPLGGNRGTASRTYLNLLLVFIATGLWHGAAYTFLAFGLWHGSFLVLERLVGRSLSKSLPGPLRSLLAPFWVLPLVVFGFLIFRAPSLASLMEIIESVMRGGKEAEALFEWTRAYYVFGLAALYHLGARLELRARLARSLNDYFWRAFFWTSILLTVILYGPLDQRAFVYFAF